MGPGFLKILGVCAVALTLTACSDSDSNNAETDAGFDLGGPDVDPSVHPYMDSLLDKYPAPAGMPCESRLAIPRVPEPVVTKFWYDAAGRLLAADELFDDGTLNDRTLYVYADGPSVYPAETLRLALDDFLWLRYIYSYDASGRLDGFIRLTSPFSGLDGLEYERGEVTYASDTAWTWSVDVGVDPGLADYGPLEFDGVADEVRTYAYDATAGTLTLEQSPGADSSVTERRTYRFTEALGSPNDVMVYPLAWISAHVTEITVQDETGGSPEVTVAFSYNEDGTLDTVAASASSGRQNLGVQTFVYACP
jgi:hypothetical protein